MGWTVLLLFFVFVALSGGAFYIGRRLWDDIPHNTSRYEFKRLKRPIIAGMVVAGLFVLCSYLVLKTAASCSYSDLAVNQSIVENMGYLGPHIDDAGASEHVLARLKGDFSSNESSISAIQIEFIDALVPEVSDEAYSDDLSGLYLVLLENSPAENGIQEILNHVTSRHYDAFWGDSQEVREYFEGALVPKGTWSGKSEDPKPQEILKGIRTIRGNEDAVNVAHNRLLEYTEKPQLQEQQAKIFGAYLRTIQEELSGYGRFFQLLMGPVQYLLFILYFTGLILTAQRFWFARDPRGFEAWARRVVQGADTSANQGTEHLANRVEKVEYAPIDYIAWSLPTIGFIGTVIGISLALNDADRVALAKGAMEQGSAIDAVTSLLGVAFDTTLIALIASALILLLVSVVQTKEASIMLDLETAGRTN